MILSDAYMEEERLAEPLLLRAPRSSTRGAIMTETHDEAKTLDEMLAEALRPYHPYKKGSYGEMPLVSSTQGAMFEAKRGGIARLGVEAVFVPEDRLRTIDEAKLAVLSQSLDEQGMIHPITARVPHPEERNKIGMVEGQSVILVTGLHRYEWARRRAVAANKRVNELHAAHTPMELREMQEWRFATGDLHAYSTIPALIFLPGMHPDVARLLEIDENLYRATLTDAEVRKFTQTRHDLLKKHHVKKATAMGRELHKRLGPVAAVEDATRDGESADSSQVTELADSPQVRKKSGPSAGWLVEWADASDGRIDRDGARYRWKQHRKEAGLDYKAPGKATEEDKERFYEWNRNADVKDVEERKRKSEAAAAKKRHEHTEGMHQKQKKNLWQALKIMWDMDHERARKDYCEVGGEFFAEMGGLNNCVEGFKELVGSDEGAA